MISPTPTLEAYAWLITHYRPGDRLFLFGFSRGAFTVRSLAGMLQVCALPQGVPSSGSEVPLVSIASPIPSNAPKPARPSAKIPMSARARAFSRRLGHSRCHGAAHQAPAVATAMPAAGADRAANVGGGYVDAGLSDVALQWMMESAASHGLVFNPQYLVKRVDPDVFGELRDSITAAYRTPLTGMPRPRVVGSGALGEALHMSVQQRWFCPSRPDELPFVPLGVGGIKK